MLEPGALTSKTLALGATLRQGYRVQMPMQRDIVFEGMAAPLRLEGAAPVHALLPKVMAGWRFHERAADSAVQPFFSIHDTEDEARFRCEWHVEERPVQHYDPVNAICDAVSAMSFALPAEDPRLICLHAAAVEMAGRLVVFPNIRRAGKSTLSAALAMAGHRVFSDDVLPLLFTENSHAVGLAMGIAPRLRLPLPDGAPRDFQDWVAAASGPQNRQYLYLTLPNLPPHGETCPVGAFVILDRQDDATEARLEQVPPDVAMDALLHQNFTRDRHSGDILQAMAATLAQRPVFRLTYSGLADAVTCLGAAFRDWKDELPEAAGAERQFQLARFDASEAGGVPDGSPIRQRAGTIAETIGETLYLADTHGLAIHRMDALATVIWTLLEDPVTPQEILDVLADAFPTEDPERIAGDVQGLLDMLRDAGLIEAAVGD